MTINCDTCQTKNVEECVYVNESHAINMSLLIDYYLKLIILKLLLKVLN